MTYTPSRSPLLPLWNRFGKSKAGSWLASRVVCFKAPYFGTIRPRFTVIQPGRVELTFKKRRAVHNHIQTVHAIAMCNAAELAGGVCMDVSLDARFRWIPVGMSVRYLKMAKTDLRAVCRLENFDWSEPGDVNAPVNVYDSDGVEVFHAEITMRISARKN